VSRAARRSAGSVRGPLRDDQPEPAEQQSAPQSEAPPQAAPDVIQQRKELAALKDQGILTEEEFATQKARILGS
jgi:hypothetical protein